MGIVGVGIIPKLIDIVGHRWEKANSGIKWHAKANMYMPKSHINVASWSVLRLVDLRPKKSSTLQILDVRTFKLLNLETVKL